MDWPGRRATPRTGQFSVEGKLGGRPAGAREQAEAAGKGVAARGVLFDVWAGKEAARVTARQDKSVWQNCL